MYMNNNQNQNQTPMNANNSNNNTSSNNSNQRGAMVPEAKQALNNMKYEIANELGINLKQGYNGDLPSRQAGYIGGYMVNLMHPAERLCTYFQLPPIRFSRNGLRNQFDQKVEYQVRVGVIV